MLGKTLSAPKGRQEDLNRHMRVLHEDVLVRIKDLTFDPEPLRREFRTGLADVREEFGRRMDPIEAVIRQRPQG